MAITQQEWQSASEDQRAAMFPLSKQNDDAIHQLLCKCQLFAKENPSLALTLCYLLLSLIGLLFQVALLFRFNFNVLPYLEITDFLLSALTNPEIIVVLSLMLLAVFALLVLERRTRRKNLKYAITTEANMQRWWMPAPAIWMSLLFSIYLILAAWSNGNVYANDIRAGLGTKLDISLIYPLQQKDKVLHLASASLISRTSSYLFVYHQGQVKVLPHANIAALLPSQLKDKRQKDEPTKALKAADLPVQATDRPSDQTSSNENSNSTAPVKAPLNAVKVNSAHEAKVKEDE
jgi:hypothetical protein